MIRFFLSHYSPRYMRSLVYMLQASEYHVGDYLTWYHRVRDFNSVERRKHFVKTAKGLLLLGCAWLIILVLYAFAILALYFGVGYFKYLICVGIILLAPYLLAYLILVPLCIARCIIEMPVEYYIVRRATKTLARHKALKIGIAGSFGKTSMREILKTVLSEGKRVAAPPHSYNTPLGISRFVQSLKGDEEILIFELGEYYPGDVRKLCRLTQPDMGIITGINEAHLQKFKSLEKTIGTIFELADYLGEKATYVNSENQLARKAAGQNHILYDRTAVGEGKVFGASTDLSGTKFSMKLKDRDLTFTSKLLGLHQVGPLAAAVHIAVVQGLSLERIVEGVANTKPFDHRLEPKMDSSGVITLDDSYNGNPDGVKAVIDFLASLKGYRRFYVTPGLVEMGAKTEVVHKEIGRQLAGAGIEKVVLINNSVTPYVEQGLTGGGFKGEIIRFDDALAAFAALPHMTVKGDVVLLQNDWPDQYY